MKLNAEHNKGYYAMDVFLRLIITGGHDSEFPRNLWDRQWLHDSTLDDVTKHFVPPQDIEFIDDDGDEYEEIHPHSPWHVFFGLKPPKLSNEEKKLYRMIDGSLSHDQSEESNIPF